MKWPLMFSLTLSLLAFVSSSSLAQFKPPKIADKETMVQQTSFIESGVAVYNQTVATERFAKDGKTFFRTILKGDNNTKGADRVEWSEETIFTLRPEGLRTISYQKDSSGAENEHWRLDYDWDAGKAKYAYSNKLNGKSDTKTISFGKDALPADILPFILRGYPFQKGKGYKQQASLVTTDGQVIKAAIVHEGEMKLDTAFGQLDAYKLEVKPSGLVGVVVPKMFIYCQKAEPHLWLRFDGKDVDLLKPRTKNALLKFTPAELVR